MRKIYFILEATETTRIPNEVLHFISQNLKEQLNLATGDKHLIFTSATVHAANMTEIKGTELKDENV